MSIVNIKRVEIDEQVVNFSVEGDLDDEFIIVTDVARRLEVDVRDASAGQEWAFDGEYRFEDYPKDAGVELEKFLNFLESTDQVREIDVLAKDQATGKEVGMFIVAVDDNRDGSGSIVIGSSNPAAKARTSDKYLSQLLELWFIQNVDDEDLDGMESFDDAGDLPGRAALFLDADAEELLKKIKTGMRELSRALAGREGKTTLPKNFRPAPDQAVGSELLQKLVKRV